MNAIAMGGNAPLPGSSVTVEINLPQGARVDVTALQLYGGGKVRGDGDMCFFNQTEIGGGAVRLSSAGTTQKFDIDTARVGSDVEKIVINAVCETGAFSTVQGVSVRVANGPDLSIETADRSEAALILCEIYKRHDQWKIRNVSQGFNGGLQALAEHFGVEVAAPAAAPAPAPKPTPAPETKPVNLNKVSLTKNERTVSLKKDDGRFGKILVNLNWNQKKSGGILGFGKTAIDLDLGAMIEFQGGGKTIVQALGNKFGNYSDVPFVMLREDDRSGSSTDGEWLEINGNEWKRIKRILVYAFIYEGVANWQETDGVIRIMVPGQPEVEVRMNELGTGASDKSCAVAMLENQGGQIRVSREVSFFTSQEPMDQAFGFGFRWRAGRK